MFEVSRDYPTALAAGLRQRDEAVASAIRWVVQKQREVGGTILVVAPGKSNVERNVLVTRFLKTPGVQFGTWRQHEGAWGGGPVLALWPNRQKLVEISDQYGVRALCVVPWLDGDVVAWQAAANPELLDGAQPLDSHPGSQLDPVVVEGLKMLSRLVNHSNELAGSMDRRDAINVLTVLHGARYPLPPEDIYAWTLSNGWPGRGAERLREMATKIGTGVRMQSGEPEALRPDILDVWRNSARGTLGGERQ